MVLSIHNKGPNLAAAHWEEKLELDEEVLTMSEEYGKGGEMNCPCK